MTLEEQRVETVADEVNVLGDQDAVNLSDPASRYPADANIPSARNVRRYPELFTQEVIDSFNVEDPNADAVVDVDSDVAVEFDGEPVDEPVGEPVDETTVHSTG